MIALAMTWPDVVMAAIVVGGTLIGLVLGAVVGLKVTRRR